MRLPRHVLGSMGSMIQSRTSYLVDLSDVLKLMTRRHVTAPQYQAISRRLPGFADRAPVGQLSRGLGRLSHMAAAACLI